MKLIKSLLKLTAVVGAVLLVGGFIAYRAGALDHFRAPVPRPDEIQAADDGEPAYFYSTKHLWVMPPPKQPPEANADDKATTMMSGSKTMTFVNVLEPPAPPVEGRTEVTPLGVPTMSPKVRLVLKFNAICSSVVLVSALVIFACQRLSKPENKDPDLLPGSKSGKIGFSGTPLTEPQPQEPVPQPQADSKQPPAAIQPPTDPK
jgi:hypothetical protein